MGSGALARFSSLSLSLSPSLSLWVSVPSLWVSVPPSLSQWFGLQACWDPALRTFICSWVPHLSTQEPCSFICSPERPGIKPCERTAGISEGAAPYRGAAAVWG